MRSDDGYAMFTIIPDMINTQAVFYFLAKPVRERMIQLGLLKKIAPSELTGFQSWQSSASYFNQDLTSTYNFHASYVYIVCSADEEYGIFADDVCSDKFLKFKARTKKNVWVMMGIDKSNMPIHAQPRLRNLYPLQKDHAKRVSEAEQRALIISYFLKIQNHCDDFSSQEEWMGMLGAGASSLPMAFAAALLPVFLGQSAEWLVLAAFMAPPLYFVERLFLNINQPQYAGVTHLLRWITSVERFLLSQRASIYLTLALNQPFFYSLGTASLAYAFNVSPLSNVFITLGTFIFQFIRSAAVFSAWADTVGHTPVTQERVFKKCLQCLETLGLIKLTCLLQPAVKAIIYGVVMQVITRDYLNFHPALGGLTFLLGTAQGALTRAYDVNQYFRPWYQQVSRELNIDNKLSRFMRDFWHNLCGNPWVESVLSLRIFAYIFSQNDFLQKSYLTGVVVIHVVSGVTSGYLIGKAIKNALRQADYTVPAAALETVCALLYCLNHSVQVKGKISAGMEELEMGPSRHAALPRMRLLERFKFAKINRGLSMTAVAMSLTLTIFTDVFLRGLIFPDAFNESLDGSLWQRLLFVYATVVLMFSVFDRGLKQCFGRQSAGLLVSLPIANFTSQASVQSPDLSKEKRFSHHRQLLNLRHGQAKK